MLETIFDVRDVVRSFHRGDATFNAIDGVSFTVTERDRLGIVGESGSGKSTLVKMLAGLLRPTLGDIAFHSKPIACRADLEKLHREVQMIFQDPRSSLDPRMRVGESITEALRSPLWRDAGIDVAARCAEVMEQVGLDPAHARRYPHQFSGGQRQRIAIARAIACKPKVLLADEPVSALDVSVRAQVLNLLGDLVSEYGMTMVFVSHDLSVVRHVCDKVLVLESGRIVEFGRTDEVYSHPSHPYTQALLRSVPRLRRD